MAEFKCTSCNKKMFKSSYITKFQNNKKEYFITPKQKLNVIVVEKLNLLKIIIKKK